MQGSTSRFPEMNNDYSNNNFSNNIPQQPYVQPVYTAPSVQRSGLSKAAKIALWSLGIIVGATVIFACAMIWVTGVRYLTGSSSNSPAPSYGYDQNGGNHSFLVPDTPGGNNNGNNGNNDNGGSVKPQSGNAGLGITIGEYTPELGIDAVYSKGLLIVTIQEDSAFNGTDVQVYDLIVAVDGTPTETTDALKGYLATKTPGDKVTLTIARYENGVAKVFDVTVSLIELEN